MTGYDLKTLFTKQEFELARSIIATTPFGKINSQLCERVTEPALPHINKITRRENDARYWAYVLEWALAREREGDPPP